MIITGRLNDEITSPVGFVKITEKKNNGRTSPEWDTYT